MEGDGGAHLQREAVGQAEERPVESDDVGVKVDAAVPLEHVEADHVAHL